MLSVDDRNFEDAKQWYTKALEVRIIKYFLNCNSNINIKCSKLFKQLLCTTINKYMMYFRLSQTSEVPYLIRH